VFLIPVIFYFKKIWSDPILAFVNFLGYVDRNLAKYLFCSHYCMNSCSHADALAKTYLKELLLSDQNVSHRGIKASVLQN